MALADNYKWEAEKDGEIITKGGDLAGCQRFSLIPQKGNLPRIDVCGVRLIKRFGRGFTKTRLGGAKLPGKLPWVQGSDRIKTPSDMRPYVDVGDLIARAGRTFPWHAVVSVSESEIVLGRPYEGSTKEAETRIHKPVKAQSFYHCVVCKGFRLYVDSCTGQVIATPQDHEMYI